MAAKKKAGAGPSRKNDPEGVRSRFLDVAAELFQRRGEPNLTKVAARE